VGVVGHDLDCVCVGSLGGCGLGGARRWGRGGQN
jgi:hypothetical protein